MDQRRVGRYERIYAQLEDLIGKSPDLVAAMATVCAVLHHKMQHHFWTGFYFVETDNRLRVGPYQGPVACQELDPPEGVCWASASSLQPVIVADVHSFPGHVACDGRSRSEITLPVFDTEGVLKAVFDVDSDREASFTETDSVNLEKILKLVYK